MSYIPPPPPPQFKKLVEYGFLTINEARAIEGWPKIAEPPVFAVGSAERKDSGLVACAYCSRPNEIRKKVCEGCGAPLPLE